MGTNGANNSKNNDNKNEIEKESPRSPRPWATSDNKNRNKKFKTIIFQYEDKEIFKYQKNNKSVEFKKIKKKFIHSLATNNSFNDIKDNEFKFYIDNRLLTDDDKLDLIEPNENDENIYINVRTGLKIPNNAEKYISDKLQLFGVPIIETNFRVYAFKNEKIKGSIIKLIKIKFSEEILKNSNITDVDYYCNGINSLYIYQNSFWIIDLINETINNINNIQPRTLHSLIYIPSKYVFIIGGKEEKKIIYYNIEENKFCHYANIDDILFEPSLIFVDNKYLFAITNVNQLIIYKTNLRAEPKIEKLKISILNGITFEQQYFGVCKLNKKEQKILFIGGDKMKQFIEYNYKENTISLSEIIEFNYKENTISLSNINISDPDCSDFSFKEKTFIPCDDFNYCQIPMIKKRVLKVIFFEQISKKFKVYIENKDNIKKKEEIQINKVNFNQSNIHKSQNYNESDKIKSHFGKPIANSDEIINENDNFASLDDNNITSS